MSRVRRKPAFPISKNKGPDQLRGNRAADQRLCFRYIDSTIPLLPKSEISRLWPSSVSVQPGLYGTWSLTSKTGYHKTLLRLSHTVLLFHLTCCKKAICCSVIGSASSALSPPSGCPGNAIPGCGSPMPIWEGSP